MVWVDLVGVTAAGNTISKSAGTGWGNGGAASGQTISADGWVEFGAVEIDTYRMCGLSDSNLDAHYTSIDYAVYLYNGAVYAFENGTNKGSFGAYQSGDRFRVERTGSTVVYKKNGVVFYTSTVASSGTLMADAAVYTVGGTVADAKINGIILGPPNAVDDLTAVAGDGGVTLSWSAPFDNGSSITGYEVQYGTVTSGLFDQIYLDDAVPGATVSGLTNGTEYQFRVIAVNGYGDSAVSNSVTATPQVDTSVDVIWVDLVGVTAAGNTISKSA
ncbi:MAG TPA: fibronectin type III domain-containing protein, partial [Candidatus Omnitrophota bacterium]|nr:fibronectin type III domain-containing protein [Candidatus Omnitrophota bacterium]